jgi:hypothetical protein
VRDTEKPPIPPGTRQTGILEIESSAETIAYQSTGDGSALVLVHGLHHSIGNAICSAGGWVMMRTALPQNRTRAVGGALMDRR